MTNTQIATITQAVVAALAAKGAVPQAQTKAKASPSDRLAAKDKSILATFKRRGIKDVVLMDRSDKSKPFNVRPFKGWMEIGRIVKKGEHGVKGLFHVSQTEELPKAAE